jgi:hypothetical protein
VTILPTRIIRPLKDAYISEFYANRNFGGSRVLYISQFQQPGDDYRSLLQFSLNSIPRGRRILSARLQLTVYRNEIPAGSSINVRLRRVLRFWRENSVTWNNQPASALFTTFRISSRTAPGTTISVNITSLVRRWYNGSLRNNGIILIGRERSNALVGFYSSESNRPPRLIVNYT